VWYNKYVKSKYCKRCDLTLSTEKFTKSSARYDGLQTYCRECMKKYRIEYYSRNKQSHYDRNKKSQAQARQYVLDIKNSNPCSDCGCYYKDEPWLLEFDHLPGTDKTGTVSSIVNSYGVGKRLSEEIEKCELVCLICHRRRTANRAGWLPNRHFDLI